MRELLVLLMLCFICNTANATKQVPDYFSHVPVVVCQPSDSNTNCGGGGTSQWTTSGSNIYYNTGNVGIGSSAPGKALDVQGDSRLTGDLIFNGNNRAISLSGVPANANGYNLTISAGKGGTNDIYDGGNLILTSGDSSDGTGKTGDTYLTTLDTNSGSAPSGNVYIHPGSILGGSGNGGNVYLDGSHDSGSVYTAVIVGNTGGNLGVHGDPGTNDFYVNGSAKIGNQNYNAPSNGLLVAGNVGIGTGVVVNALDITGGPGGNGGVSIGTAYAGFRVAPTNGLLVLGNVGIGTHVVNTALAVSGNIRLTGTNSLYLGNDSSAFIAASTATAPAIVFDTNSAEIMRITNGGNVGIGSITPGQKLDVQGAVRIVSSGDTVFTGGNVGIGSAAPGAGLDLGTSTQILSHSTTGIGASVKTGANTACNTTCGTSGCLFGFDTGLGGTDVVNCASALADTCLCLGP